ncbi:hypothetical protein QQP08_016171 [Theobroma cacao]|uniref:Uncharacterized protein n=1 Tax=Theobroma cacao TaxID=3641 RepID=A0A061F3Q4_THECC|nr:Uncharacterized protein TCM_026535 [Theobroma cacao]WRX23684.1 hypothetical protein QQP08_016171 [Theobroma cacao]
MELSCLRAPTSVQVPTYCWFRLPEYLVVRCFYRNTNFENIDNLEIGCEILTISNYGTNNSIAARVLRGGSWKNSALISSHGWDSSIG